MPLSIALRTSSQPPVCAAALPVATRTSANATQLHPFEIEPEPFHAATTSSPKSSRERAARAQQVARRARLDDDAVDEHDRAVGELDGREALRRDEHRLAFERRPQPLDEPPLRERVDRGERIVEHDDARAGDERARERDALALAAGEIDAALADQRVVAVRQLLRERVDAGGLAGREHLVPVGVLPARRRFSRSGTEKSTGRCVTSATSARSSAIGTARVSTPPTSTPPPVGS